MATIKLMLRTSHPRKDGTYPIVFRITLDRKTKFVSTGFHVLEKQWKDGQVIRHVDATLINTAIEAKRASLVESVIMSVITPGDKDLNELAGGTTKQTVFNAVRAHLQRYENEGKVAAFNRLQTNLTVLKKAWGKDIALRDLNAAWVQKYIQQRYKDGNIESTIKKNLQDLAVVITALDLGGKNYFTAAAKAMKTRPVEREKLSAEEMRRLEEVKLSGLTNIARDMFLFAYYCHGMRFESVATFQVSSVSEGLITYRMNKGKKVRQIAVHEKLAVLIAKYAQPGQKYLFPVVKKEFDTWTKKRVIGEANALIRKYLTHAAAKADIDKAVHFHMSRHTFATLALNKGISVEILKDALGHTNYATTQQYLKSLSDQKINDALRDLW